MAAANPSRVIGVTYQDPKGKDAVLLNAPDIKVKLLANAELTGFLFKDKNNGVETCLSGLNVTGVIYEDEDSCVESILTARKVLGIIYQESTSADRTILNRSKLLGVTYQEAGSTEVKLLGGTQLNARILNGSRITGVVYREEGGITASSLRESVLTGAIYKEQNAIEEDVLTSLKIIGIIYRDVAPSFRATRRARKVEAPTGNGFLRVERLLLYLLPIIGVLGLVVPYVLEQFKTTILISFLAVPLIVVPVAYLLYQYYSKGRSTVSSS
ncbi:MAG: hypothetical protein ACXW1E_08135 [Halobacteriota archaeon]